MDHTTFPPEFSGPWALCYKLFSKCYISFFDESYKRWKLYCIGLSALIHNITVWCFISKVFTENINMFEVAYMIPLCTGFIQASSKTMIMLYKKPDIENLITELASIWRTTNLNAEQIRTKKYFIKQLKFQQSIYHWGSVCGTWLHVMTPVTIVLFRRIILNEDYKLTLAFGSVYPFDPSDNWIIYLLTYSFQAFNMVNIVYGLIASEFLLITFCANLAIEFALLREDLEHVMPCIKVEDERDQSSFERRRSIENYRKLSIEEFIRRHQRLIRLAVQLDDVFNGMILLNILCTTVMICFFGFASTVARGFVETVNNYEAVVAMLLQVYMFSYYGELMKDESLRVADSVYKNPWYMGDIMFQRTIVFIIAQSQRACCLSAWKQVPVTLNMFAKVSSSAWSYFSIVTTVYSRHQDSNSE